VKVVNSILSKIGLKQNDLKCGAQYPTSKPDADVLIQQKIKPSDIHNNCSGKHAGMLAMCVYKNYSLSDYLHPEHPLQQEILETCAAFYEYPKDKMHTALDGCSAPIFSVPVYHQALGYKNLALMAANDTSPREKAARKVIQAVSLNPFMIAGSRRYCTDMMQITAPKVIGKTGAEGVFCMSFTEKMLGVCIKIDDGKMQPQYHVAQALLEQSGLFSKEQMQPLHHYMQEELRNFNKLTTGEMVAVKNLFQDFPKL
jgi:L-asparaginase II